MFAWKIIHFSRVIVAALSNTHHSFSGFLYTLFHIPHFDFDDDTQNYKGSEKKKFEIDIWFSYLQG